MVRDAGVALAIAGVAPLLTMTTVVSTISASSFEARPPLRAKPRRMTAVRGRCAMPCGAVAPTEIGSPISAT
jgi:hypothetical protein